MKLRVSDLELLKEINEKYQLDDTIKLRLVFLISRLDKQRVRTNKTRVKLYHTKEGKIAEKKRQYRYKVSGHKKNRTKYTEQSLDYLCNFVERHGG